MIVTVSRAYGAAAASVARHAAERLGYRVLDEELPVVVDVPRSFTERVLRTFTGGVPEVTAAASPADDDAAVRGQIESVVRAAAASGDVLIVGRMGGAILAGRSDVVRVFVTAPPAWRAAHLADLHGLDRRTAEAEIARVDDARRSYAREQYRVAWGDPKHYDLVLDTSRFGIDGAAAVIVAAVRAAAG